MKKRFGDEFPEFLHALNTPPVLSVRKNPAKQALVFEGAEKVPWEENAFYLEQRPPFVLDPLHHAGAYYVQEASSMLFANGIDWKKDLLVIDLCAAPGGKSTLALSHMSKNSFLVSNEIVRDRAMILQENLNRWGYLNCAVTRNNMQELQLLKGMADVVLVDAPCSGEGMFRKDKGAIEQWNEGLVYRCAADQKEILATAFNLLKDDGLMVYSTCTFESDENENNLVWLHREFKGSVKPAELTVEKNWGVEVNETAINNFSQPWYASVPHKTKGEGLFLSFVKKETEGISTGVKLKSGSSMFRKPTAAEAKELSYFIEAEKGLLTLIKDNDVFVIPENYAALIELMYARLRVLKAGVHAGAFKGKQFVPSHELAMSQVVSSKTPRIEVSEEDALKFLKKEPFDAGEIPFKGWGLISYKSIPIGWIKNLGNRFNNHFPSELKIRVDVDRFRKKFEES